MKLENNQLQTKIDKSIEIGKEVYFVNIKSTNKHLLKKSLSQNSNPMISFVFSTDEKYDKTLDLKFNFFRERKQFTAYFWGDKQPFSNYDYGKKNYLISKNQLNNNSFKDKGGFVGFKGITEVRKEFTKNSTLQYLMSYQPYKIEFEFSLDNLSKHNIDLIYAKEHYIDQKNISKLVWQDLELKDSEIIEIFVDDLNKLLVKNF